MIFVVLRALCVGCGLLLVVSGVLIVVCCPVSVVMRLFFDCVVCCVLFGCFCLFVVGCVWFLLCFVDWWFVFLVSWYLFGVRCGLLLLLVCVAGSY